MEEQNGTEPECCPKFDPKPWEDKVLEWKDRKFIKGKVCTFFYIPLNFGSVIKKLDSEVKKAEAQVQDWMCLSDHTSKWKMDLFLAVNKEVLGSENITISGKFLSKVYEGSFKDTGKWCKDFEEFARNKELEVEKQYMWYTTCPGCSKKYGKNYVVILGKVNPIK